MNYSALSLKTRRKYLEELVTEYQDTKIMPGKEVIIESYGVIWPCSHRFFSSVRNEGVIKCPMPEIEKKLKSDVEFLHATSTNKFHWNLNEVIVGDKAVVAGMIEDSIGFFHKAEDFFSLYTILEEIFSDVQLPLLTGDFSNLYSDEPDHWVEYVAELSPGSVLLSLIYGHFLFLEREWEGGEGVSETEVKEALKLYEDLEKITSDVVPVNNDLMTIEDCSDFSTASKKAKELAIRFGETMSLRRTEISWAVMGSLSIYNALFPIEEYEIDNDDTGPDLYAEEVEHEFYKPIFEEYLNEQDSWSRSDEDGWFYKE
jgi:hypothetical protein